MGCEGVVVYAYALARRFLRGVVVNSFGNGRTDIQGSLQ